MHMVMAVTMHSRLCEEDTVLRRSLLVRNPKVDALNFLQANRTPNPSASASRFACTHRSLGTRQPQRSH
jgi:hypothetical protein